MVVLIKILLYVSSGRQAETGYAREEVENINKVKNINTTKEIQKIEKFREFNLGFINKLKLDNSLNKQIGIKEEKDNNIEKNTEKVLERIGKQLKRQKNRCVVYKAVGKGLEYNLKDYKNKKGRQV